MKVLSQIKTAECWKAKTRKEGKKVHFLWVIVHDVNVCECIFLPYESLRLNVEQFSCNKSPSSSRSAFFFITLCVWANILPISLFLWAFLRKFFSSFFFPSSWCWKGIDYWIIGKLYNLIVLKFIHCLLQHLIN